MATLKELTYMVLDELKLSSDDTYFNEEHVSFLISKYRGLILQQHYKGVKKDIPESNFQTICVDLIQVPAIAGIPCEGGTFLRTSNKIPSMMGITSPKIYAGSFYESEINYVSRERMKYVGHNRWLQDMIYASLGPDGYIYFTSSNPQFLYLEKVQITGIFENPEKIAEFSCNSTTEECDFLDREYPLEEGLIPTVLELVVKELHASRFAPEDKQNNANDDLSEVTQSKRNG
jgi:hypothetical protein